MSEESIVYVLTNPAMPGMVKIGMTAREDITERFTELYTTGVPLPFECAYAAKVANAGEVEKAFHTAFGPYRVNPRREFFEIEPEQVRVLLKLKQIGLEDMTPTVKEEAEQVDRGAKASAEKLKQKHRRPKINFEEMGILEGSRLDFTGEGDHHCTVVNKRKVEYDGLRCSLTSLTRTLLGGPPTKKILAYWRLDGENLTDIYEDTYPSDM